MIKKNILILLFSIFLNNILFAKTEYFQAGVDLFNQKKFKQAKFKFEQDIVLNPKNEPSYLYLSKIFNIQDNDAQEEQNLNTVILLNPNNEEALYQLAKLKLTNSDYKKSTEFNKRLKLICEFIDILNMY